MLQVQYYRFIMTPSEGLTSLGIPLHTSTKLLGSLVTMAKIFAWIWETAQEGTARQWCTLFDRATRPLRENE